MKTYTVYEGTSIKDNSLVTDFRNKNKAIVCARKSTYAYAVVMEYDGTEDDEQAYFRGVLYEKGNVE